MLTLVILFKQNFYLAFFFYARGLFALHRSWQKIDELQHEWHTKAEELASKNSLIEVDAAFVRTAMEQNEKLKDEVESSKKKAA